MSNMKKKKTNNNAKLYLVDTPPSPDVFDNSQLDVLLEIVDHELTLLRNNRDYYQEETNIIKQSLERRHAMQAFSTFYEERLAHVQKCLLNLSRS